MAETIAGKPEDTGPENTGNPIFEALKAGLDYNNAHWDEYLEADLARDPCFLPKKGTDPDLKGRITKAVEKHKNKLT